MSNTETTFATIIIGIKHNVASAVRTIISTTGTVNTLMCRFEFRTTDWVNRIKKVVFQNLRDHLEDIEKNKYVFLLDENNECFIPAEILSNEGEFLIGVFGTNTDGSRLVTNMIPFKCEQGCYGAGVAPAPITPSEYDELIQLINQKQNKLIAGNGITIDENNIISSSYDDAEIKHLIAENKNAITTLSESVNNKIDQVISDIVDGAPEDLNTFKEIADWINSDVDGAAKMANDIADLRERIGTIDSDIIENLSKEIDSNKTAIQVLNGDGDGSVAKAISDTKNDLESKIKNKVDKVNGKGLSTNDYTTEEKNKLENIAENAQVNTIESVSVNGVALSVNNKSVNISVPTGALSSKDKVTEEDLMSDVLAKINGKLDASDVTGDMLTHNASEFAAADHNHNSVYARIDHSHNIEALEQTDYIILNGGTASTVL